MVYLGLEDVVGNAMRLYNPDTGRTMIKSRPVVALEEQLVDGKLTSPLSSTDDVDDKVRVKQLSDAFATEGIKDIRPLEMGDDTDIRGMEISRLGTYCEFENSSDFSTVTLTSPEKGTSTYYVAGLAIALQLYNRRKHKKGPLLVMSNPYQRISDAMADGAVDKKFDSDPFAKSRILWKNVGHKWRKGKKIYRALVVANDRMNHTVDLMYEDSYVENAIPESELIWSEAQREELLMASLSRVDDRIQMMSSAELIPQRAPCAINRCVCSRRGEFKHLSSEMFRNPVLTAEKASQGMIPVPYSYVELLGWPEGPHRDKFLEAHNKEMTEIFNPLVGSSVPLSAATDAAGNLSGSRMIYEIKFQKDTGALDKYKARFVVLGYTQQHGVDFWHTFAATPQRSTLRLAITLAKRFDLKLYKLDVKTAFLQGEMDYNLYCRMPEGMREYQDGVEMVYFLHKAIYGTKQAALRFYIRLRDVLVQFRYKGMWLRQSSVEPCLYFLVDNSGRLYGIVGVHVDDQIVGMQDEQMYKAFMEHLTRYFKMTEAPANEILGVTVNELPDGSTILHQRLFIELMAQRHEVLGTRCYKTPLPTSFNNIIWLPPTQTDKVFLENKKYSMPTLIGELLWAVGCRPDVSFAVSFLSRFSSKPTKVAYNYALRVVKYLYDTREQGIVIRSSVGKNTDLKLVAYADADHAHNVATRKSVSGVMVFYCGCLIEYFSKSQSAVALSSAEAELVAILQAGQSVVYLKNVLSEFNLCRTGTPMILEDNQAVIQWADNDMLMSRLKHIDVKLKWIRDQIRNGVFRLHKISTNDQIADMLTKSVPKETLDWLLEQVHKHSTGGFKSSKHMDKRRRVR